MRILFFNELYDPNISGGAEICVQLLAESLAKAGHSVYVCSISDANRQTQKNGVTLFYLKYKNVYWEYNKRGNSVQRALWHLIDMYNLAFRHDIAKLLNTVLPDIVHTNNLCGFSSIVWTIAKEHKIPIVHTIHDHYLMCYRTTMFDKNRICTSQCRLCRFASLFSRRESRKVDAVIGVSKYILKRHLANGYFKNANIKIAIPNGVASCDHTKADREKNVIGFLGSVIPFKGVEKLIGDFCRLDNKEWKLKIAGNGNDEYIAYLKEKYAHGNIEFVGRVNPDAFLSSISLLVVPSLGNESFGRVVVEAMFNDCPVIVSERGGIPEIVNDSRFIFDPISPDELFLLLKDFTEGRLSLQPMMHDERYTLRSIMDAYLQVYGGLTQ